MQCSRFIITLSATSLLIALLYGCEQATVDTTNVIAAAEVDIAPEGAIDAPIVCISEIVKDTTAHVGRVAARGVVSKVFKDRRAFTVANIVEGATCCASGCGTDTIPARVPLENYAGDLPNQFERVIIVGELIANGDDGFDFVIEEVWVGGKVVLKRQT